MKTKIKHHWMIIVGLALIIAGVASSIVTANNSTVPNDADIGGGILFMFGIMAVAGGILSAWSRRHPNPDVDRTLDN